MTDNYGHALDPAAHAGNWPCVTVIVPVRNGARVIGACLDALLAQDYPGPPPELIVVDNGSTDATAALVASLGSPVRLLREPQPGASSARNTGIGAASHEFSAFTDADCVPRPDWLKALVVATLADPGASFVGGRIAALLPTTDIGLFAECIFDHRSAILDCQPPYVITANLMVRRQYLLRIGLFDPAYPRGQDTELAWRAHYFHGARFAYAEQAVADHVNVTTLVGLCHKGFQHGRGSARLWRDFQPQLGRSPRTRMRDLEPFRRAARETAALLPLLWRRMTGSETDPRCLHPFYGALFKLARQISFIHHSLAAD